jgi:1,4-dihydroxy-2-naphthoate octaprenyltransferase
MFKKKEGLLIAGLVCILFAFIFKYSFDETGLSDFFQGVFMGLSIVFNITYLIKIRLSSVN